MKKTYRIKEDTHIPGTDIILEEGDIITITSNRVEESEFFNTQEDVCHECGKPLEDCDCDEDEETDEWEEGPHTYYDRYDDDEEEK